MTKNKEVFEIPDEVAKVAETLEKDGFEAHLVGGCVRDLLVRRKPTDWDITTDAKPEEIQKIFKESFYENEYGTVGVVTGSEDPTLKVVEVTPYRLEGAYSDKRRPDSVSFSTNLEDDLKRRDFTINAIALKLGEEIKEKSDITTHNHKGHNDFRKGQINNSKGHMSVRNVLYNSKGHYKSYKGHITDPYKGQEDIGKGLIKTVGNPLERFSEDGLRLLRAVRIAAELGFMIENETADAIFKNNELLKEIASERVRDEFTKIIMSDCPMEGITLCSKLGLLQHFVPELEVSFHVKQNKAHSFDVGEHLLRTVAHGAKKEFPLEVRLASLFHDISKPETRRWSEEKKDWTFYGHDVVGARVAAKILERLKFPMKLIEKVTKLVRWHMFFSDTEVITHSAVRRLLMNVGKENIWDLMNVRACDRIGTGRPKESPYRLRKYHSMIEEVLHDPITVGMLKIKGGEVMDVAKIQPSQKIGFILHALLEEVLEEPTKNRHEYLTKRTLELSALSDKELEKLGKQGKERRVETEEERVNEIRGKYWVK
ncbi:MAG: HD domain-containing protein [bacterium]|nr:HD domain-containing protein [bacterium]